MKLYPRQHHRVLRVVTKIFVPLVLLFALYVQFHGDYGPGGGFQAGVIFASAFILYGLVFGLQRTRRVITPGAVRVLMASGVLIYAGTGAVTMLLGGDLLDYGVLAHDPLHGQHWGIFVVEAGVGITVAGVMIGLFYAFASRRSERPSPVSGSVSTEPSSATDESAGDAASRSAGEMAGEVTGNTPAKATEEATGNASATAGSAGGARPGGADGRRR